MKNELSEALIDFYQKLLKPEIEAIKDKLTGHDEKFIDVIDHFDSLYKRLDRLDDEYYTIVQGLKRIEESLESGNERRDKLERRIKDIKEQVNNLQLRLEKVEKEVIGA